MRIAAYYQRLSLATLRRAVAPLSVLSSRGHQCSFQQLSKPQDIDSTTADVVLLCNWAYTGKLPHLRHGVYIYDLTDASFLSDETVANVVRQSAALVAATDAIANRARQYVSQTKVMPSYVWKEWLLGSPKQKQAHPFLGCLGNFDWSAVVDPIRAFLADHSDIRIVTDNEELHAAIGKRSAFIVADTANYNQVIRSVYLGVVPGTDRGRDPGIIHEYGLCGVPSVVGSAWEAEVSRQNSAQNSGIVARGRQQWQDALAKLTDDDRQRGVLAENAQRVARSLSVVQNADHWLHTMEKFCPTMGAPFTLI